MARLFRRLRLNADGVAAEKSCHQSRKQTARSRPQRGVTMLNNEPTAESSMTQMPLLTAADVQDNLMVANNDLERLAGLLTDATETLMGHFYGASAQIGQLMELAERLPTLDKGPLQQAMQHMGGAVTALQFQDMSTQLIAHLQRRLRNCADRLARDVMGDDEDGEAVIEEAPLRPNPVTQDEMDAGSIELF
ncbi:hypothetical protein [Aquabacterium humicola]|uniref:hypothetical protein n=1 Tax=Aquabacterium humicola TaxID=3237377 RepID=UPI0032EC01C6